MAHLAARPRVRLAVKMQAGARLAEDFCPGENIFADQIIHFDMTAGFRAVIFGHSHQPNSETKDGVLYFNPGSAGPRRFSLPISVGRLTLSGNVLEAEIIELAV